MNNNKNFSKVVLVLALIVIIFTAILSYIHMNILVPQFHNTFEAPVLSTIYISIAVEYSMIAIGIMIAGTLRNWRTKSSVIWKVFGLCSVILVIVYTMIVVIGYFHLLPSYDDWLQGVVYFSYQNAVLYLIPGFLIGKWVFAAESR